MHNKFVVNANKNTNNSNNLNHGGINRGGNRTISNIPRNNYSDSSQQSQIIFPTQHEYHTQPLSNNRFGVSNNYQYSQTNDFEDIEEDGDFIEKSQPIINNPRNNFPNNNNNNNNQLNKNKRRIDEIGEVISQNNFKKRTFDINSNSPTQNNNYKNNNFINSQRNSPKSPPNNNNNNDGEIEISPEILERIERNKLEAQRKRMQRLSNIPTSPPTPAPRLPNTPLNSSNTLRPNNPQLNNNINNNVNKNMNNNTNNMNNNNNNNMNNTQSINNNFNKGNRVINNSAIQNNTQGNKLSQNSNNMFNSPNNNNKNINNVNNNNNSMKIENSPKIKNEINYSQENQRIQVQTTLPVLSNNNNNNNMNNNMNNNNTKNLNNNMNYFGVQNNNNLNNSNSNNDTKEKRWKWLVDIRDIMQRPPSDINYDPTTLYIEEKEFRNLTDTRKQYWTIKRTYFNYIVFIQVGSFFELYERDAFLGAKIMDMKLTERVNMMSVGFPLGAYDKWAKKFVALGYSVIRVDQIDDHHPYNNDDRENSIKKINYNLTEEYNNQNNNNKNNQLNDQKDRKKPRNNCERKIIEIITPGTQSLYFTDDSIYQSVYILTIVEQISNNNQSRDINENFSFYNYSFNDNEDDNNNDNNCSYKYNNNDNNDDEIDDDFVKKDRNKNRRRRGGKVGRRFGVCLVDCSIAEFQFGIIDDDFNASELESFLIHYQPKEIHYLKGNLSEQTFSVLYRFSEIILTPGIVDHKFFPFWDPSMTHSQLSSIYFPFFFNNNKIIKQKYNKNTIKNIINNKNQNNNNNNIMIENKYKKNTNVTKLDQINKINNKYEETKEKELKKHQEKAKILLNQIINNELLLFVFGGCLSYFKKLLIDNQLLSQLNFTFFPSTSHINQNFDINLNINKNDIRNIEREMIMTLDGHALRHLEILPDDDLFFHSPPPIDHPFHNTKNNSKNNNTKNNNNNDNIVDNMNNNYNVTINGSSKPSLLKLLMNTQTPFGSRLLKRWICNPLRSIKQINLRLSAVDELIEQKEVLKEIRKVMSKITDVERVLMKLHSQSHLSLFQFIDLIQSLEYFWTIIELIHPNLYAANNLSSSHQYRCLFQSELLKSILSIEYMADNNNNIYNNDDDDDNNNNNNNENGGENGGKKKTRYLFPSKLMSVISEFSGSFDNEKSRSEKKFIVNIGYDDEYDQIMNEISNTQSQLDNRLIQLKKILSLSFDLSYTQSKKENNIIEIPILAKPKMAAKSPKKTTKMGISEDNLDLFKSRLPNDLVYHDQTKTKLKLKDLAIDSLTDKLIELEENLKLISDGLLVKFMKRLDGFYFDLKRAMECIAQFDCLISLALTSSSSFLHSTKPFFVPSPKEGSRIKIKKMIHPFLSNQSDHEIIPNDLILGGDQTPRGLILTGPNMGGKSTLLRQTAIIIIMAQIGCYVPAEYCEISPIDRIFTRIGAMDNIFESRSTFMVELLETSTLLRDSTRNSIVVLDELGRGTSTFDGSAIAHSVLYYLSYYIGCLYLFATHYHIILDQWKFAKSVELCYMDCYEDEEEKTITFLYKLKKGICPSSHGMNVAKLAGLDENIIQAAEKCSKEFEITMLKNMQSPKLNLKGSRFNLLNLILGRLNDLTRSLPNCDEADREEINYKIYRLLQELSDFKISFDFF